MASKDMDPSQTLELQALRVNGHNGHNGHAGVPAWVAPIAFRWPAPPYCQPALSAAPAHACRVEFADGVDETVELISIEETGRTAQVRTAGADSQSLALDRVRSITATRAVECVLDVAAGADKVRTFVVHFKGGAKLSGRTRGLVRSHGGLFFFLAQTEQPAVTPCYVPLTQVESFNVGASLGETVKPHDAVETRALDEALDCPAEERDRRLGEYLASRAIVSVKDLKGALETQDRVPKQRLGEILIEAGLITQAELELALARQTAGGGRRLGDVLIAMGVVSLRTIQVMLSEKLGIPYVDAAAVEVDGEAVALVPQEIAQQHGVLPLARWGRSLIVAVENPLALEFEQRLRFATGCAIVAVMADARDIAARVVAEYQNVVAEPRARAAQSKEDVEQLARRLERETPSAAVAARRVAAGPSISDNTLVKLVNKIILDAHARGASDIHIETSLAQRVRIRFRCDGELTDYLQLGPAYAAAIVSRIKIMAGLDISERRLAQDGKIRFNRFSAVALELRVAVVPTSDSSEDIVLRILGGAGSRPIDQIGLSERNTTELKRMTSRNHGLVLVCGPTGSGKTSTLHSVLRHLNRADLKIWTAEDPVEIVQPGLRQVQVNPQVGWTFAQAMRSFLRADPDVIMVGEMRDAETARTAIEASLTGHLVLSTLHTNSAAETVTRLLDMGMDPFNFSDSLVGVLSQRLARRLCPSCRRPHELSGAEAQDLAAEYCQGTTLAPDAVVTEWRSKFARAGKLYINKAVGCMECDRGYRGRLAIHELLSVTPEMRRQIRTRGPADELAASAQAGGMRLLRQDALEKALAGELDLASARSASS
jgi:type II secretory ATPase GspE/PulE/Tfp pilus assembly ATPase PilB-like protein